MSVPAIPTPVTLATYAKSLVYVAVAVIGVAITALSDSIITPEEILNAVVIGLGAFVVYVVPNMPAGAARYSKFFASLVVAAVVALISFLSNGVTPAEWLQVGVAALAGVGVVAVPNKTLTMTRGADGTYSLP